MQLGRGTQFGLTAFRSCNAEPVEKAGERCAIACLRGAVASLFDRIFLRARDDGWVAQLDDFGAARSELFENRRNCAFRIDRDTLALHRFQRRGEGGARVQAHGIAQMLAHLVGHLVRLDIEIGGAIIVDDGKGERDRGARHIATADIERPGDAIERGEDSAIQLTLCQPFGDCGALFSAALAGIFIAQHDQLGIGRIGATRPNLVDRVFADRNQLRANRGERLRRRICPALGMHPWIITDPRTLLGIGLQPVSNAGLRYLLVLPQFAIDLLAHLDGIAPVDENRGFL